MKLSPTLRLLSALLLTGVACAAAPADARYPYGGAALQSLVNDSYRVAGQSAPSLSAWLTEQYREAHVPLAGAPTLKAGLAARREALQRAGKRGDDLARDSAQWAHTFIKKILPKFSLERGYEFSAAMTAGERQCLLQSVLIASLLQDMGLDAGAVMVWQNQNGQESNLGHVVAVLRLPSGSGLLLDDASDPEPFVTHQGLLVRQGQQYAFVHPMYSAQTITAFERADNQQRFSAAQMRPLDLSYLKSQFNYYRGERADGGFMGAGGHGKGGATPQGLARSAKYLQAAVKENPHNALATYVLGLVERKKGQNDAAAQQVLAGVKLYREQGHLPAGPTDALTWAQPQASKP